MECFTRPQHATADEALIALDQIQALVDIAMNSDLNKLNGKTAYHFFCVIDDIIATTKNM